MGKKLEKVLHVDAHVAQEKGLSSESFRGS